MSWVNTIKEALPAYAKDARLNLDAVVDRSSLEPTVAAGCCLAAAIAAGNQKLIAAIEGQSAALIDNFVELMAAKSAAVIMAQNNVWYPYVEMTGDPALKGLPAQLRMNAIGTHGGTTKANFEAYSLAASIVGKCHFCVKAHYENLRNEGYSVENLRDIGRIAAVMNSVAKALG